MRIDLAGKFAYAFQKLFGLRGEILVAFDMVVAGKHINVRDGNFGGIVNHNGARSGAFFKRAHAAQAFADAADFVPFGMVNFQFFFVLQTCLLLSIISFLYTLERVADTFFLSSQYQLVAIFFGIYVAYFALKMLVYWLVNNVFFGRRKSVRWLKQLLVVTSVEGIALFPLVMLQSYFDLSIQKAVIYVIFVIVVSKIMLLYKSFVMFFRHKNFFLQIILYFCALEIMPLLSLGGILVKVVDYLKINF